MVHFSDGLGASTERQAEGKGRNTEMCRDELRPKCPQTNGLPSPPPGHFRLKEKGNRRMWA